jgi:hypothetical protein
VLAHVDVETTGLAPGYHEMVDLGVVMTDMNGQGLEPDGGARFFVRIDPAHPGRADPHAAAVNGYSVERWARLETVSRSEAVSQWVEFHRRVAQGRNCLFCAYNAWFDIAFCDHCPRRSRAVRRP